MRSVFINKEGAENQSTIFRQSNAHFPDIERFQAIIDDGNSQADLINKGFLRSDFSGDSAALSQALTHTLLWSSVLSEQKPLMIMEDNALLCQNFVEQRQKILGQLNDDWDIILFGYDFDASCVINAIPGVSPCGFYFDFNQMRKAAYTWHSRSVEANAYPLLQASGLYCYAVSPRGARLLLEACIPLRSLSNQPFSLDKQMSAVYPKIKAFAAFPPLAISGNDNSTMSFFKEKNNSRPAVSI
ncbi:glycosyltransferase family 25 protein [Acetobacter sp. TBRC 12305]|uniref:Glycosyltransferase family 25 protein n=1 Tax=Acetobacter garciniae TaxID=2817435 RepID=A0A939HN31_9PROT|nr:glycosyltransferase family 25 protein [Acetobacter garciniae]MBO1323971.1 glycosyltransferase family 25 protein [Acetobacter garciniae]MBX0343660.1 glycosyltransferase family 25 protein [Acetobacter garciniae]